MAARRSCGSDLYQSSVTQSVARAVEVAVRVCRSSPVNYSRLFACVCARFTERWFKGEEEQCRAGSLTTITKVILKFHSSLFSLSQLIARSNSRCEDIDPRLTSRNEKESRGRYRSRDNVWLARPSTLLRHAGHVTARALNCLQCARVSPWWHRAVNRASTWCVTPGACQSVSHP